MSQRFDVPKPVQDLAARLSQPHPMRRGSLGERFMKCGQSACPCHHDPKARHGPYFSLTRVVEGATRSKYVSSQDAALVRAQIESGQQFRADVEQYWRACEHWSDQQLQAASEESAGQAEKKGSAVRSRRRSNRKSKRS